MEVLLCGVAGDGSERTEGSEPTETLELTEGVELTERACDMALSGAECIDLTKRSKVAEGRELTDIVRGGCTAAAADGAEYLFRVNDDTELLTSGWAGIMVDQLKVLPPPTGFPRCMPVAADRERRRRASDPHRPTDDVCLCSPIEIEAAVRRKLLCVAWGGGCS